MSAENSRKTIGAEVDADLFYEWDKAVTRLRINKKRVSKRNWARAVGEWWIGMEEKDQVAFLTGNGSPVLTEDRVRELIRHEIASALGAPAAAAQDDAEAQEAVLQNKRKTRSAKRG